MNCRVVLLLLSLAVVLSPKAAGAAVRFVNADNLAPSAPYTNWATAANVLQLAVNAASPGDEIVVTNGVYRTGGVAMFGLMTNRVAIAKAVLVRSVNGPDVTIIQGFKVPGTTNGDGAIRCVYLAAGASLVGFTLTGGGTRAEGDLVREQSGGAIWAESSLARITNCVLSGNAAAQRAGGAYFGTYVQCLFSANAAGSDGGGGYQCILRSCRLQSNTARTGGGAYAGTITDCLLVGNAAGDGAGAYASSGRKNMFLRNIASNSSGGAYGGLWDNCVFLANTASSVGGAECFSTLEHCTVVLNSAGGIGGGVYFGRVNNSIVYDNIAATGENHFGATLSYSCTTPLPAGENNFTAFPRFVEEDEDNLRLQPNSPCINAGHNPDPPEENDLEGLPRVVGGATDVGAYEYQTPASQLSYAWLQEYSLPIDGSADLLDSDGDRANNWQEWRMGTSPKDSNSVLRLLPFAPNETSSIVVRWQSVPGKKYFVERGVSLQTLGPWLEGIVAEGTVTMVTNAQTVPAIPSFYRVGVPE